ncbi:MAG: class I SAM-dependent methyltransferase [Ignavibacteria bacterium]|nr:class I SAM-dependent methyltransferase [Ignavibacteria bacterium]MCU7503331.1 class I SAM-dependent methyltransferase [Ignavibacteria bacterium]MCU7515723.1 class I SAM-dependent methyltransferase [Ignavibacteria bacterium]
MLEKWNERFSEEGYAYGKEPNGFFKEEIDKLKPGRLLLVAEGEGRNAVYAASKGWQVDAFDFSQAAKEKALKLAEEYNTTINYTVEDLSAFSPKEAYYDAAAIIYMHLPEELRQKVNGRIISALKAGGKLILEVFEKDQLEKNSGGPKDADLLYSLEDIVSEFTVLDFQQLSKEVIELNEGKYHQGEAVVIRFTGTRE